VTVISSSGRTDIFIGYNPKDARHLDRLKTHLAFYKKSGTLNVWDYSKFAPGSQWRAEILRAIKKTRIAILLISADFLASPYLLEVQLLPLLAAAKTEGVIIIPVILSACAFQRTTLAQFQAINDPLKPLDIMRKADREKTWAELSMMVHTEMSKASGEDPDSDWYAYHLREMKMSSSSRSFLSRMFKERDILDYAIIDLGTGQRWLTSRLYIFALMLERMRGLQCLVFLETKNDIEQRFLGLASPAKVRWALAYCYPWLETAFAKAYSYMDGVVSATGALDPQTANFIVQNFLKDHRIQQILATGTFPSPDNDEWEALGMMKWEEDEEMEDRKQFWEHAKWLDATHLEQDLGNVLQQDESIWLKENPYILSIEQAHSILHRNTPFIAFVDEEKRFRSLIDRQDLIERAIVNKYIK
jgi:hypothetical protein